ncbi:MAG: DUF1611 domain-containing protein [Sedimentibacter sp.]|uniref:DUF1611 domain-containing protein n=1 Tax=Sedimentibacter sp. TaxID=1960295 RepID=UPI002980C254|nr:DUF1611 domain-containing protein [Sedimentibacter sp.]MDW5298894.1 DUF1611 domain-containing protein [Sedimentibacter sp.]
MITNGYDNAARIFLSFQKRITWIKQISVFPSSEKEMKQFIDFKHLCKYPIINYYDFPRTIHNIEVRKHDLSLNNNVSENDYDTLVLGYFYDNMWEGNVNFGYNLVNKALEHNKNFFVFDIRIYNYLTNIISNSKYKSKVYLPRVTSRDYEFLLNYKHLPVAKCPILMTIGTSNKQGKFTTQLKIKEILEEEGYVVSHISTEPQGELFGADHCFPYGHMSTVEISPRQFLQFLRTLCNAISYFNKPDIIITGHQGGLIPRLALNAMPYFPSVDNLGFLHGILPDIIICTINPEDSIEMINNTINVAYAYTKCKVLFYVLSPIMRTQEEMYDEIYLNSSKMLNEIDYQKRLSYFQEKLNKPVYNILNNDKKLLIKAIEDACSR